jgi:excisionase family DNA binding protein
LDLLDRVTVAEAAERLGISQDAVRQRIRRGTIDYERTEEGRLYVYLTPEDTEPDLVPYTVPKALVEHLQREIDFLRKELERKDHLLAAALERIPVALEAPPKAKESPVSPSEESSNNEPSSTQKVKDPQVEETLPQKNPSRLGRPGAKAVWARLGLAAFLAGAIPAILANLVLLQGGFYFVGYAINDPPVVYVYLFLYFLVHLIPLPLGMWAGLAWPGSHPKVYASLGLAAGAIEALFFWGIVMISKDLVVWTIEDVVAIFSTATLFVSGALYGDLIEARRKMPTALEGAASAEEAALNKTTMLLIQSLGPALLGLVGTLFTALITLLKS